MDFTQIEADNIANWNLGTSVPRRLLAMSLVLVVVWLGVAWRASKVSVAARVKVEAKSGEEWQ